MKLWIVLLVFSIELNAALSQTDSQTSSVDIDSKAWPSSINLYDIIELRNVTIQSWNDIMNGAKAILSHLDSLGKSTDHSLAFIPMQNYFVTQEEWTSKFLSRFTKEQDEQSLDSMTRVLLTEQAQQCGWYRPCIQSWMIAYQLELHLEIRNKGTFVSHDTFVPKFISIFDGWTDETIPPYLVELLDVTKNGPVPLPSSFNYPVWTQDIAFRLKTLAKYRETVIVQMRGAVQNVRTYEQTKSQGGVVDEKKAIDSLPTSYTFWGSMSFKLSHILSNIFILETELVVDTDRSCSLWEYFTSYRVPTAFVQDIQITTTTTLSKMKNLPHIPQPPQDLFEVTPQMLQLIKDHLSKTMTPQQMNEEIARALNQGSQMLHDKKNPKSTTSSTRSSSTSSKSRVKTQHKSPVTNVI